jgi:hypothetical protein
VAEQALRFLPRANSIFSSEKLLPISNPDFDADRALFTPTAFHATPLVRN